MSNSDKGVADFPSGLQALAYAYGSPQASAQLKSNPADFVVEEQLAYSLSGEGEHLWLWVEKTGQNTDWVAKQLAKWAGIAPKNVGVAGKKDRQAVTYQWMSLHLPGQADPALETLAIAGVRILKWQRHHRKLQTGGLSGNRFTLTLRNVTGDSAELEARLQRVREQGVPNYFGEQRFGNGFQNLPKATQLFQGQLKAPKRHQKSLYISAARSWIFNEMLSQRIEQGVWNHAMPGDVFQLQGSQKWFVDDGDPGLAKRVDCLDVHPTGALTGRGDLPTQDEAFQLEQKVISQHPIWQAGLEKLGLKQERRALRVWPQALTWQWSDTETLVVAFDLPAGSYATMVVRELVQLAKSPE